MSALKDSGISNVIDVVHQTSESGLSPKEANNILRFLCK